MSQGLILETRLNKTHVPVTRTQQLVYLLITARPGQELSQERMNLNFGFVLDRSGSMRGKKVDRLREAVLLALNKMTDQDRVSITVFNDRAQVVAQSGLLGQSTSLRSKIQQIRAGGGTHMSRGLSLGLREVYRHYAADRANQVLLLTDGQTYGDEDQCIRLAREAGEHKIAVQALGLGDDWNEDLLDQIGQLSAGGSDLIEAPDEIEPLFGRYVERSQRAVIRNANMTLRLVAGVAPRQVWQVQPVLANLGYSPIGEHDVQVHLGTLDAQEGKSLLIELLLPPRPVGQYRIAQSQVTYDLPLENQSGTSQRRDITLQYTNDRQLARRYNPAIMNLVEKVTAYKLQTRALDEAQRGNVAGATQKLRAAATRLLQLGEEDLAQAAHQEAENLEQGRGMSSAGTKKLRYKTRKLTQTLPELEELDE